MKFIVKKLIKGFLLRLPKIGNRIRQYDEFREIYQRCGMWLPGHYYSPIPDLVEVKKQESRIFKESTISDVDLNESGQIKLLHHLKGYYDNYPYGNSNISPVIRYEKEGAYYRYSDAVLLYSMLRYHKPKKVIEIGSGHSSAIMLDVDEIFHNSSIEFTFIEPYPEERLFKILKTGDFSASNINIHNNIVQLENEDTFANLNEHDILFIDSSHVSKVGSDLNFIFFKIFPLLKPGVIIHFHDIFFPFQLPSHWVFDKKWFWNENYLLRAFLMNNNDYKIVLFNSFLHGIYRSWFEQNMPECLIDCSNTGSIWIEKLI